MKNENFQDRNGFWNVWFVSRRARILYLRSQKTLRKSRCCRGARRSSFVRKMIFAEWKWGFATRKNREIFAKKFWRKFRKSRDSRWWNKYFCADWRFFARNFIFWIWSKSSRKNLVRKISKYRDNANRKPFPRKIQKLDFAEKSREKSRKIIFWCNWKSEKFEQNAQNWFYVKSPFFGDFYFFNLILQ